ncbi:hypothetical protein ACFC09_17810 [Streptomyces sp. NPDC056161]|uniref:GHMP family kinase ATP-binding protein n=1 Tax=Streptomyces sp. NPDC056161 TaxID=3345732 RepID=UPI0035DE4603
MTTAVSTAPLRLSLAGGGTDLPEYYRHGPTNVTAVALDRFVHVAVADTPEQALRAVPAAVHRVSPAEAERHPYVRAARAMLGLDGPSHVAVASQVLPGSGLGGSGAFTVALLDALARFAGRAPGARESAARAFRLERELLGRSVGQQDQWIAALGGAARLDFSPDGTVDAASDPELFDTVAELLAGGGLVLARTGEERDAADVLGKARPITREDHRSAVEAARTMDRAYRSGNPRLIGAALRAHWSAKIRRNPAADHAACRRVQEATGTAVHGLKVVGAGGGGHLLLAVEPTERRRTLDVLTGLGLTPLPVRAWPRGLQQGLPARAHTGRDPLGGGTAERERGEAPACGWG